MPLAGDTRLLKQLVHLVYVIHFLYRTCWHTSDIIRAIIITHVYNYIYLLILYIVMIFPNL